MNKKEKFENFLESLKGHGQDTLIESVKKGFHAYFEVMSDIGLVQNDLLLSPEREKELDDKYAQSLISKIQKHQHMVSPTITTTQELHNMDIDELEALEADIHTKYQWSKINDELPDSFDSDFTQHTLDMCKNGMYTPDMCKNLEVQKVQKVHK